MTTENKLPSQEDAFNQLFNEVHVPVFFNKLASFGIQATTEKEAEDLLLLAAQLRDVPLQKEASSRFSDATAALAQVTGGGFNKVATEQSIKKASVELSRRSDIYASVLSLKLAEQGE